VGVDAVTSRGEIDAAFWALLTTARGFTSSSQSFKHWDQVTGAAQMPFLTMYHSGEERIRQDEGLPSIKLFYNVFIYTFTGDPSAVPSTPVNLLLDRIDQAVKPVGSDLLNGNRQTLGNLVTHCYPLGRVFIEAGGGPDGKSIASIPFEILTPWFV
jgi:hypothetical protein